MAKPPKTEDAPSPAGRADILHLAGAVSDATIAAIQRTGATYLEVEEAAGLASGDPEELGRQRVALGATARAVYDILVSDAAFLAPERED